MMAKTVCHFSFDDYTYCVTAQTDLYGRVCAIASVPGQKGPRAKNVAELADVFGALLSGGAVFSDFQTMRLSPVGAALIGAVERRAIAPAVGGGLRT